MTLEAQPSEEAPTTTTRKPRGGRAPRSGNTLVQKMAAGLEDQGQGEALPEASATSVEVAVESGGGGGSPDGLVAVDEVEARRQAVALDDGQQQPEFNPFVPREAVAPAQTKKIMREEGQAERARTNQPTPSTKRLGSLGKKLPGAERAKVHKRMESGQLAYVGEYTEGDLSQSQDMESFLSKYIKPAYGPGEYQITGVDAHGRQFDMGIVNLLSPLMPTMVTPEAQLDSPLGLLRSLIDKTLQQQLQQPTTEKTDPIEMLGRLHDLKTKMDPPAPAPRPAAPKDNSLAIAVVSGLTTVASAGLALLMQPKPMDPMMALFLKKAMDDEPRRGGGDALPPMPAPVDPTLQLKNLAEVVQTLGGGGNKNSDDRLVDFLMKDRMTPADVIGLIDKVKSERGTDGLKKSMEDVGIMLNAVQQIRQHTETGGGAGFMDAIVALSQNTGIGGAVADAIRSRAGGRGGAQQLPPPQQTRALPAQQQQDPLVMKQREIIARRLLVEEQELIVREKQLAAQGVVLPKPLVTPPAAALAPAVAQPAAAAVQPAMAQAPAMTETADGKKMPKLPRNIGDFINHYIEAKDDAELVEITLGLLRSLQDEEDWKPYSEVIFRFIAQSDKARFLHYMASFFVGLRGSNLINDDLANKIMQSLSTHFETVVEMFQLQLAKEGESGDGESEEGDGDGDDGDDDGDDDVLGLGNEEPLS